MLDRRTTLLTALALLAAPAQAAAQAADAPAADEAAQPTQPTTTRVIIVATPPDAEISLGEQRLGQGRVELDLEPGTHDFHVRREGYKTRIETVILDASSVPELMLSVNLSKTDPDAIIVGRTGGVIEDMRTPARKVAGWTSLGVGVGLVSASVTLAALSGVPDACGPDDPRACEEARNLAGWSSASGAVGGALIIGGLGLLVWDSLAGTRPEERAWRLTPTRRGAAVQVRF